MKRRKFIQLSGVGLSSSLAYQLLTSCSTPTKRAWGVQLFTIATMAANDFEGTLKTLQELGYKEIEFFGPYEFSAQATIDRWVPIAKQMGLTKNAFYGKSISDIKRIMDDHNISSPSAHLDLITMRTNMDDAMKNLRQLGIRYVGIPAVYTEKIDTLDDYKILADEFNTLGKQMKDYGISFVYHNHGYEISIKDGQVPMDILINNTDANLVKFEMDIFWMQAAGGNPIEYLKKYPGRFKLMHVKDSDEKVRFSGDGSTPEEWMALFPKMADPGTGVFDIKEIIAAATSSGTEHFFLERDLAAEPIKTLENTIQYFNSLDIKLR